MVKMTAAGMRRFSSGSLLLTLALILSTTIATPVLAEPPWVTTGNRAPGDRSGGGGGSYYYYYYASPPPPPPQTQNQGQGQESPPEGVAAAAAAAAAAATAVPLSKRPPRRAFKISSVRPEGAKCDLDLYCNGCNWHGAYCTAAMSVIATDLACERACACVVSGCPFIDD